MKVKMPSFPCPACGHVLLVDDALRKEIKEEGDTWPPDAGLSFYPGP